MSGWITDEQWRRAAPAIEGEFAVGQRVVITGISSDNRDFESWMRDVAGHFGVVAGVRYAAGTELPATFGPNYDVEILGRHPLSPVITLGSLVGFWGCELTVVD